MNCPKCSRDTGADAGFCAHCGTPRAPISLGRLLGAFGLGILALAFGFMGVCGAVFTLPTQDHELGNMGPVGLTFAIIGFSLAALCINGILRVLKR